MSTKCQIRWITSTGKTTEDTNDAVAEARVHPHTVTMDDGSPYQVSASEWFPICREHLDRLERTASIRAIWETRPLTQE